MTHEERLAKMRAKYWANREAHLQRMREYNRRLSAQEPAARNANQRNATKYPQDPPCVVGDPEEYSSALEMRYG